MKENSAYSVDDLRRMLGDVIGIEFSGKIF